VECTECTLAAGLPFQNVREGGQSGGICAIFQFLRNEASLYIMGLLLRGAII